LSTPTKSETITAPNMRDVARAAGVSVTTVSVVANGKPGIGEETRERVLRVMAEIGYTQERRRNGTTGTKVFGLLMESLTVPSSDEGFYQQVVAGIEESVYRLGHHLLLHLYRPNVEPLDSIRELMGRDIDGLIIANDGDITADDIRKIAAAGLPVVLVENYLQEAIHSVTADNLNAGRAVTEHLIQLGHRRIGTLAGPSQYSSLRYRLRGHLIALLEHGLPIDPALQPPPLSGNPRKGYLQMQQLLALPEPPTAVFAVSDKTAFGAMEAIKDAGLRIPDDISIVGIDDVRSSAYTFPPLTTYHVPKYRMGETAVMILNNLLQLTDTYPPARTVLLGHLIVRESCGAPPNPG
jgi:DNA-binding LacI/PurR family transcriptional regulator